MSEKNISNEEINEEVIEQEEGNREIEEILAATGTPFIQRVLANKNIITYIAIGFVIVVAVIFASISKGPVEDKGIDALEWVADQEKIDELKFTLIDGVTIEDRYSNVYVHKWSYATDGENEYLKVETEDNLDIYDVTDEELEESIDKEEMKKNFVGKSGIYTTDNAQIQIIIDDEYNVQGLLKVFVPLDPETNDDVEEDDIEGHLDDEGDQENVEKEGNLEEVETEEVETEEVETEEVEENQSDEDEQDTVEEDEREVIHEVELIGKIISVTEIEFVMQTAEVINFKWLVDEDASGEDVDNEKTPMQIEVSVVGEFMLSTQQDMPEVCEVLTNQLYTYYIEEQTEEGFDEGGLTQDDVVLDDNDYSGNYDVIIKANSKDSIKFDLYLHENEMEELIVQGAVANKQNDIGIIGFESEELVIYFEEIEDGKVLVTGYDNAKNMVIRLIK